MPGSPAGLNGGFRRLGGYVRPIVPRWILGLVSALAASAVALAIPQVLQELVNTSLRPGGRPDELWRAALVITGLGVLEAAFFVLRRVFVISPATDVENTMRVSFYRHLQQLPAAFHDRWGSGQLLSRSMADLGLIRRWLAFGALMLVVSGITVTLGTVLMFRISWLLGTVFVLAAVPVMYLGFRFRSTFGAASRLSQDQAGDLATTVEESVQGIRIIKAFGRGRYALENFRTQASHLRDTEVGKARSLARFQAGMALVPELALAAALVLGIISVADGQLTVGGLVAFFATAAVVAGPVESFGPLLGMTLTARTAVDRHFDVMGTANTITDPPVPADLPSEALSNPLSNAAPLRLEFRGVQFRHPQVADAPPLLDGVSLEVRAGETMALVGATGSGKSLLLQLVPRLYDVSAGSISLAGQDIRGIPLERLRSMVSVAFEDPTLFSASVRDNVMMGARPEPGEDVELLLGRALEAAAAEFAYALPQGLDTVIGEEGLSLSGGQRQRLALARAIAARPQVLLLDDPLSAVDVRTEELVTARLREVLTGTTTLIVAHRPSTVALAERVALLENGRISAVGTHADLLSSNAAYRHVISSLAEEPLVEELTGEQQ